MITTSEKIRFIESVFGKARIFARNVDVHCPLPACKDSTKKKLSIRLEDDLNHCWVCGWSARTLLPLIIKFGSQDDIQTYKTKFLPEVIDVSKYKPAQVNSVDQPTQKVVKLPSDFKLLTFSGRTRDPDVRSIRRYVENRGLTEKDMWRWKLGTSNEPGLRRRVIVPSFDQDGNLNYYTARAIDSVSFMKYTNSEGDSKDIIFNELNIDWNKRLTIVEGPFDLMKCSGNATCILGSNLSERSLLFNAVLSYGTPVLLLLDSDMEQKTQNIARLLTQYNIDVWVGKLAIGKDPGSMTTEEVDQVLAAAKRWSWNDLFSLKLRAAMSCSLKLGKERS